MSISTLMLCTLLACCSSGDAVDSVAQISTTPTTLSVDGNGGNVTISVTCDEEWGIYSTGTWVTAKPSGGLKGSSEVTLTVAANPSQTSPRTVDIIVKSGSTRVSVPLTQAMLVKERSIADANLKAYLLANYDTNKDGVFSMTEAAAITSLNIAGKGIASFAELSSFTALTALDCSNNSISELDLSALTALTSLKCADNSLTSLDIKANTLLTTLDCTGNNIGRIYVWAGFTAPSGFSKPADAEYILPDVFVPEGYSLLWSDEFEGTALNADNWTAEVGNGSSGWGNNELQYYTARTQNASVDKGYLTITAVKESYSGSPATSARLITKGKVFFKYGYVVASIKLPKTADGLWPAFWMMGNDFDSVSWPACGETDILEMGNAAGISAGTQERYLNGACHWGQSYANHVTYDYSLQDGEFHTFTCIWDEEYIRMYIDLETNPTVKPYFEMNIAAANINGIFNKENFILLNLAVGGNFPALHDINQITALSSGSAEMVVDYVRVFQKKQ